MVSRKLTESISRAGVVTFLKKRPNSIDREANIGITNDKKYWITNLNMPYQGTISKIVTADELTKLINNGVISVKWNSKKEENGIN